LLEEAKKLGDYLVVIVNNDIQVNLKGSKQFMNQEERCAIIKSIKWVDEVFLSIDTDRTIIESLKNVNPNIFAKGGDSTVENTPELKVCEDLDIKVIFNVGGGKIQSSSWLKNGV
jgi:D-beta-D-heptose 7-phosphate kinase/D-beta-D-heptose 1-phosphate adenosyltransferase